MNKGRTAIVLSVLFVAFSLQAGKTVRALDNVSPKEDRRVLIRLARAAKKGHLTGKDAAKLALVQKSVKRYQQTVAPQQENYNTLPPQDESPKV
ncbi:MAG: hypothetical protein ACD_64C00244G0002 [uncultured bacterium]|nr:MAG: hypothetical protein ACD_64C00244G0002 [uncultured bacterium]